jgi:hypothetical protein
MIEDFISYIISNKPHLVQEARDWAKDSIWDETEEDSTNEFIDEITPERLLKLINRHYEGGLKAFVRENEPIKLSHTILHKLASIANDLDTFGFTKEANMMDRILIKLSNLREDDFLDKYSHEKRRFYDLYEEGLIDPGVKDRAEKIFHELENPGTFPEIVPRIGDPRKKMLEKIHFMNLLALSKRQHIKD